MTRMATNTATACCSRWRNGCRTACAPETRLARLGGDEFVLVLETLDAEAVNAYQQAQGVGAKVLAALAKPFQLDDLEWNCSGSLGLTLFGPHPAEPDMLLKQADMAMYEAKKAGRNALRCYSA
ncbi:diguanylate cyclase domain-containing protein [Massilia eburnea]|uniref:diguanylate cyclase domain-containing protein n=1 Tax=Massilia eburnea TaxID=1776165 RepID=UPI003D6A7929